MANWQELIAANLEKIPLVCEEISIPASDRSELEDLVRKLHEINQKYVSGELRAEVHPKHRTEFQRLYSQTQKLQGYESTFGVMKHVQNVISVGPHGPG